MVHFPNELNQKPLTVSQLVLQLQTSRVQSQSESLPCVSNHLLKFSPTKPAAFSDLSQSKLMKFSQNLQSLSLSQNFCVTSIYTQPIRSYLKQTNFNLLSKQCNLHLQSVTFRRGHCLLCKQINIKLCSVIQLLLVQLSPYLKYMTFGLLCKQIHSTLSLICTWHINQCLLCKH